MEEFVPKPNRLWIAVDVGFISRENPWDLEDGEQMAFLRLLAYCKQHETDGIVSLKAAKRIAGEHLARLVEEQLVSIGSRYVNVLDWLKWNESKEHRQARQAADRERKRRSRTLLSSTTETETEKRRDSSGRPGGQPPDSLRTPGTRRELPDPVGELMQWAEAEDRKNGDDK
jgi:hypothetical protein